MRLVGKSRSKPAQFQPAGLQSRNKILLLQSRAIMAELMSARDRVRAPNVRLTDQQFAVTEQYRKSQEPQQAKAPQLEGLGPPVPITFAF
jgi:hypothetical protein